MDRIGVADEYGKIPEAPPIFSPSCECCLVLISSPLSVNSGLRRAKRLQRLFRPEAGVGADDQLGVARFGRRLAAQEGAEDGAEKA